MPEGGDQLPSGRRAMMTPEPVAPETWKPARAVVKMARPTALLMTEEGIVRRVRFFLGLAAAVVGLPSASTVGASTVSGAWVSV